MLACKAPGVSKAPIPENWYSPGLKSHVNPVEPTIYHGDMQVQLCK
jgi:hypothetical protein